MRMKMVWSLVTVAVVSAAPLAQSRADFSGTWEFDAARTAREAGAKPGGGRGGGSMGLSGGNGLAPAAPAPTVVRISQAAAALTVERVSGQVPEKVVHTFDGARSVSVNGQSTLTLTSRWDGARLISEGTSETRLRDGSGSVTGTVKEVRWLEPDGTMAVETTRVVQPPPGVTVTNAGQPIIRVQYFKKK